MGVKYRENIFRYKGVNQSWIFDIINVSPSKTQKLRLIDFKVELREIPPHYSFLIPDQSFSLESRYNNIVITVRVLARGLHMFVHIINPRLINEARILVFDLPCALGNSLFEAC